MRALEYALRLQAARAAKPVRPRKWPRPRYPTQERLLYYRQLAYWVDMLQYVVRRDLMPALPGIMASFQADQPDVAVAAPRRDAADLDAIFAELEGAVGVAVPELQIEMAVQNVALRTAKWNGDELTKQIQQVARINLFDDSSGLADHLGLFVQQNVALVKSLQSDQLTDLRGIIERGARAGLHHTVVAEQIRTRFDVPKKRAALIATDQVGKLNSELNQIRQQRLGVRRYRWSSSQDERVRPRHRALNNTVQDWSRPPVVDERTGERGHPGQPIRCRCSAIPIIDDVLADAGLIDPRDVEEQQPVAIGPQREQRSVTLPEPPRPPPLRPVPPPEPPPPEPPRPPPPSNTGDLALIEAQAKLLRRQEKLAARRERTRLGREAELAAARTEAFEQAAREAREEAARREAARVRREIRDLQTRTTAPRKPAKRPPAKARRAPRKRPRE